MASRLCACVCGESCGVVRADKEGYVADWMYLMFQSTECSCTFGIRALVGTGKDLVLRLRGGSCTHWGRTGRGKV